MTGMRSGQAMRSQQNAADRARRGRSHLSDRSESDIAFDLDPEACVGCGVHYPRGKLLVSENGSICVGCDAESIDVPSVSVLPSLLWVLPAWFIVGFQLWTVMGGNVSTVGMAGFLWVTLLSLGVMVGTKASSVAARGLRHARNPVSLDGSPPASSVGLERLALVLGVASVLGVMAVGLYPFVG